MAHHGAAAPGEARPRAVNAGPAPADNVGCGKGRGTNFPSLDRVCLECGVGCFFWNVSYKYHIHFVMAFFGEKQWGLSRPIYISLNTHGT